MLEEVENHLKTSFDCDSSQSVISAAEPTNPRWKKLKGSGVGPGMLGGRLRKKIAIREARLKEIKQEVLNSNKLKSYFQDNPKDLQVLRHDKVLHTVKLQPHLVNVPEYIIPTALKSLNVAASLKKKRPRRPVSKSKSKFLSRAEDPLISLKLGGVKKKKK